MILVDYPGHLVASLLLAILAALVFFAFRSGELRNPKVRSYRIPLILLQYASILVLLLILWNPSRARFSETLSNNSVLALFDTSESMSVVEDGRSTRLDKALAVFEDKFHSLDKEGVGYRICGFDNQSYHSGSSDFLRRWGSRTDLHSVFSMLSKYDVAENPPAVENRQNPRTEIPLTKKSKVTGAVIFTDGQVDDKNISVYLPLRKKNFQTVLVGIGSRDWQTDVAIKSIDAPSRMAIDTVSDIQVVVAGRNLQGKSVIVELLKDDFVIATRDVGAESFDQSRRGGAAAKDVTVEFTVGADRLGSYAFSARAKTLEQEVNRANNVRSTMIEVVEETGLKVLFYSQVANFNVGKVRQALARDKKIQLDLSLDVIRTPALAERASKMSGYVRLPDDRRGFYKYDIIVLGPCDLEVLTDSQLDGLYSFVADRGGGLILLPGKADFGPGAWVNEKAKALIPVIFDSDYPTIWPSSPDKIELTIEGIDSEVLGPAALEEHVEPALPYYRVSNSKPASTTLASIKDMPVISIHRVGRGRVCLLNASQLFRWYREDIEGGLLYQTMAGLTAHLGRTTSREAGIELFVERSTEQTDRVKFEAYVCDNSFDPVSGANVLLSVKDRFLSMDHIGRGHYIAEVEDFKDQAVVATAQAEVDGVFLGEKTVAVNLPPAESEMTDTELDEKFLRALAKKVNGKYFHADDVDENIAQMFEAQTRMAGSRQMTSIWPNWPLLIILCTLLSISWFLRRAIGLV